MLKYTTMEQRQVHNQIIDIRNKMKVCRERYLELEKIFFKLNESIDNKYRVKNFKV